MLTTLRIKNLALVPDLTVEFQPGLNVVTGETGAGKSILIGALNLVLGGRADRTALRAGADSCSVEAVFDVARLKAPLPAFLEEAGLDPCEDGQLVLKRTFSAAGANRQFINGSPAVLATLATLGEWLVDIHGPHDHQSLLHPARQLAILDAFGGLAPARESFAQRLRRRAALEAEKAALVVDERTYAQQLDLLRFQTREISEAGLQPGEDERLEQDHRRASSAARLLELCRTALDLLAENEPSLLSQSGALGRALQELHRLDPGAASLADTQARAATALQELQSALSHYADRVELDPERLRDLEARLDLLHSLKRKYGPALADVIAFGEDAGRKLASLEQRDTELARLNAELATVDVELWRSGQELSALRRKLIPRLRKAVSAQLADLGFQQSRFDVVIESCEMHTPSANQPASTAPMNLPLTRPSGTLSPSEGERDGVRGRSEGSGFASRFTATGIDTVEFQFAPNPGEPARPLRAIASSGEMARVMLALKTVLAAEDEVPLLVFDEVDANVGGETAHAVGDKMRQIARCRQVLCVTHLAPVAACANAHLVATKKSQAGRTVSEITPLAAEERVAELARMLGGRGGAARQHAEALLQAQRA